MIIRKMVEEDRNIIFQMMKEFYSSPAVFTNGSDEIFKNDIDNSINDNPYLEGYVVEEDNKILGYTMLAKSFSTEFGKPCIWIEDIYLLEECRGRGIGRKVLEFIEEKYPNHLLRLEAEEENVKAVKLYRKCGFTELPYLELKKL